MNHLDNTQVDLDTNGQAEALYTTLEQAYAALTLIADAHFTGPTYPAFMVVLDLLHTAKAQNSELISRLPAGNHGGAV